MVKNFCRYQSVYFFSSILLKPSFDDSYVLVNMELDRRFLSFTNATVIGDAKIAERVFLAVRTPVKLLDLEISGHPLDS